ncbi:MAG: hypothetical protein ACI4F9_08635 [Lachnospiraceae bacterium]
MSEKIVREAIKQAKKAAIGGWKVVQRLFLMYYFMIVLFRQKWKERGIL